MRLAAPPPITAILGGYGVPGGYRPHADLVLILSIADFWTSYESFFKLTQVSVCGGSYISASSWCMLGGYPGGPEGTAVACVAYGLLLWAIFQGSRCGVPPFDIQYMGNCGRRAQWSMSVANQAVSRNTPGVLHSINNQVAGPCTKMVLYETLVGMTNMAASGVSNVVGTRSAGGRLTNYLTPLEHQFGGEVYKAAAGMSREQANEIARAALSRSTKISCARGLTGNPSRTAMTWNGWFRPLSGNECMMKCARKRSAPG